MFQHLETTAVEDIALIHNYNEQMASLPSLNEHFVLSGESTNIFSSYLDSLSIVSCTQKMYTSQNRQIIFWLQIDSSRQWQALPKPRSDSPMKLARRPPPPPPRLHRAFSVFDWLLCVKRGLDSLDPVTFRFWGKQTLDAWKGDRANRTFRKQYLVKD